jgi:hypothetical protein
MKRTYKNEYEINKYDNQYPSNNNGFGDMILVIIFFIILTILIK